MLTDLRRAQILADARERGSVSLRELSHRFEVSIPTIRRDLSALAGQGLLRRVHGGAIVDRPAPDAARPRAPAAAIVRSRPVSPAAAPSGPRPVSAAGRDLPRQATDRSVATSFSGLGRGALSGVGRGAVSSVGRGAVSGVGRGAGGGVAGGWAGPTGVDPGDGDVYVARHTVTPEEAAAMVTPGTAVGISGGSAAVRLAGLLDDVRGLTVVTPVPAVAAAVRNRATVVVLVGGVRTPSGSHAGPLTEATLARLNLDLAFVAPRDPTTTADTMADRTDRAVLRRATVAVFLTPPDGSGPRPG